MAGPGVSAPQSASAGALSSAPPHNAIIGRSPRSGCKARRPATARRFPPVPVRRGARVVHRRLVVADDCLVTSYVTMGQRAIWAAKGTPFIQHGGDRKSSKAKSSSKLELDWPLVTRSRLSEARVILQHAPYNRQAQNVEAERQVDRRIVRRQKCKHFALFADALIATARSASEPSARLASCSLRWRRRRSGRSRETTRGAVIVPRCYH
jgi:hypothetical protein